jgi:molybdenum cofactor cytidylyltransferase
MSGKEVGVILLAAGNSSRMGRAKQLLPHGGSTLLRHAAKTALETDLGPVIVVLGAEAEACCLALQGMEVEMVLNEEWEQGMGTSIHAGIVELERLLPDATGALIMLHDQPAITAARLRELVAARLPDNVAVASVYDDAVGVPAFFARELFDELRALHGAAGARGVLDRHAARVGRFAMPEARLDIDTPADYERLRKGATS